jgi:hypothetical protein
MIDSTTFFGINPVFSGHETFPMRYGWLKKVYDACLPIRKKKNGSIIRDLFNSDEAIVTLGVGKNMVSSMRHWAVYSSLLYFDKNKNLVINDFAEEIFRDNGLDPWLENYATMWFIHWNLVAKKQSSNHLYTYLWVFNCLNGNTFDKDILFTRIMDSVKTFASKVPSPSTLKRDIECFLGMYSSRSNKDKTDEDNIESPLTELELISPLVRRNLFQVNRGIKPTISIYTFLFVLFKFWDYYSPNSKTLSFESICYNFMSPGRIFLLNEDAIAEYLHKLSDETRGAFEYTETAGMKQIIKNSSQNKIFDTWAIHYFRKNYNEK